ncbi:hypothetical protein DICPUDRAFT_37686 [Dictyostelium purpureum]|uniref:peptidylprolyl isomerase n=1 Tax=Dictyostelium purpureum TaxID=5786 RepID=F0ZT93_DICPU|nr:uncharacterized protein DICPUDRAFT_37686 [Dictyostelium purpureum]EGC32844.1 hypothetical protein DICPUDRAFT_37686 [Dictyostelium purpureum]|eukprot:XP_003290629.1 hypothetical protein DICPUDRAFT_37686 [Dictyostelium purpureum]
MKFFIVFLILILILHISLSSATKPESVKIVDTFKPDVCKIKTKVGQKVTVHYTGKLINGYKFDSSVGGKPFTFTLGQNKVIKGWEIGILDMCVHQKRVLRIPPSLGYGDRDLGDIPPNSYLIFEVELIKIN